MHVRVAGAFVAASFIAASFIAATLIFAVALVACARDAGSSAATSNDPDAWLVDGLASPTATAWTSRASLPIPQQETAVVALGDRVYVLGGLDADSNPIDAVHVYDPATNTWSKTTPLPKPMHHVNAVAIGGGIWVLGGLVDAAFNATDDVYRYDPRDRMWAPRAPMRFGQERGAAMIAAIGSTIYMAGGLRGGAPVADFTALDIERGLWSELPPLPLARDHGAGAAFDGVFYAIGGRGRSIGGHTARVDAFDPISGTWSERSAMPTSRGGCAAAVARGRIVVIGGEGDRRRPDGVFPEVEAYDPVADVWTTLEPMPTPRHGMGAATVDDVVFVPGGGVRQSLAPTDVVEALSIP